MFLGHDYASYINPFALPIEKYKNGIIKANWKICPANVKTEFFNFYTSHSITFRNLTFLDGVWGGSSSGHLFIENDNGYVEEFFSEWIHDIGGPDGPDNPIYAYIRPNSYVKISFTNETDSAVDRFISMILTGTIND